MCAEDEFLNCVCLKIVIEFNNKVEVERIQPILTILKSKQRTGREENSEQKTDLEKKIIKISSNCQFLIERYNSQLTHSRNGASKYVRV